MLEGAPGSSSRFVLFARWLLVILAFLGSGIGRGESTIVEVPAVRVVGQAPRDEVPNSTEASRSLPLEHSRENSWSRVLSRNPSVQAQSVGGEGSSPVFLIRGHDPIQTRYFLEGIPLTGAEFHNGGLTGLPLEAVDSVDIHPEGSPIRLSEDGLGGALNYRLRRHVGREAALFRGDLGSFGFMRVLVDAAVHSSTRVAVDVSRSEEDYLFLDSRGTPFNPDDDTYQRRAGNSFERLTIFPRVELLSRNNLRLDLLPFTSISTIQVPGPVGTLAPGALWQRQSLVGLRYQVGPVESETVALFFGRWDADKISRNGSAPTFTPTESESFTVGATVSTPVSSFLNVTTGAQWDRFETSLPTRAPVSPHQRLRVPLGVDSRIRQGDFVFSPGILAHWVEFRSDTIQVPGTGPLPSGQAVTHDWLFSPRLAVRWEATPRLRVRTSMGVFERAPALIERFGSPRGIVPSPELISESAVRAEIGADYVSPQLGPFQAVKLSFTQFYSRPKNLISLIQDSSTTYRAVNIGSSEISGQELGIEAVLGDFSLRTVLAFLQTENLSDKVFENGRELPGRPPYRVGLDLLYQRGGWGAGYGIQANGPTFWDPANTKRMSSWVEHHAYVSLKTAVGNFLLEGRNLTDALVVPSQVGSLEILDNTTGSAGYPAPGRRIFFTWRYEL